MVNSYKLVLRFTSLTLCLTTAACATNTRVSQTEVYEPRWINASIFDVTEHKDGSLYSFNFDVEFTSPDNKIFKVKDSLDVKSVGEERIASRDYTRWDFLKTDCEVVNRFYLAPDNAVTYWPTMFDISLIKTFPATAVPFLGGQGLDGRNGNLAQYESTLTLIESGEHSVKVSYDGMVVNYVLVARGDFNRDGYQDLFVRMDWYIEDAFGDGNDWVVLTKISPNSEPIMLWRK